MEEIIYFEINDWFAGRDYPNDEIFSKWINERQFMYDEWCRENKLCVMCGTIDMSMDYCVAAPKSWVLEHCPKLLTDEEYTYKTATVRWDVDKKREIREIKEHTKKYSDFVSKPDDDGNAYGFISGWRFPEYCEENLGVTWNKRWWGDNDDEEDNEE